MCSSVLILYLGMFGKAPDQHLHTELTQVRHTGFFAVAHPFARCPAMYVATTMPRLNTAFAAK